MIAFLQIILLKNYEVKMHQRFCKPNKNTPLLPPPQKKKKFQCQKKNEHQQFQKFKSYFFQKFKSK